MVRPGRWIPVLHQKPRILRVPSLSNSKNQDGRRSFPLLFRDKYLAHLFRMCKPNHFSLYLRYTLWRTYHSHSTGSQIFDRCLGKIINSMKIIVILSTKPYTFLRKESTNYAYMVHRLAAVRGSLSSSRSVSQSGISSSFVQNDELSCNL